MKKTYKLGIPKELYNQEIIQRFPLPPRPNLGFLTSPDHRDFKAMDYLIRKNKRKYRGYQNILISYPRRVATLYKDLTNIPRFVKMRG